MKIWEVKDLGLENLTLAEKNIKSIAIPALGCGVNLIDPVTSARAALNAIIDIENETIGNDEQ